MLKSCVLLNFEFTWCSSVVPQSSEYEFEQSSFNVVNHHQSINRTSALVLTLHPLNNSEFIRFCPLLISLVNRVLTVSVGSICSTELPRQSPSDNQSVLCQSNVNNCNAPFVWPEPPVQVKVYQTKRILSKGFDFGRNFICKIMVHCSWIGNDGFSFADLEKYQKRCSTEKSKYTFEYQHDVIPVYDASKIDLRPSSIIVSHHRSWRRVFGILNLP